MIKTADYTPWWRPFFSFCVFKALNITFLLADLYFISIAMRRTFIVLLGTLVQILQWMEHEQTWPFLRCHLKLSLPRALGPSKPHLQSLSQSQWKGQLSLTGIPSGLSVREEVVTCAAQADAHVKPSQFNEARRVDLNKSCLSLSSCRTASKLCWMRLFSRRSGRWSR